MGKYDPDNPEGFQEPVLRCCECQKMVFIADIRKEHTCSCGCPRFRNIKGFDRPEMRLMLRRGVDQEYFELFGCKPGILDKVRAYVGL